MHLVTPKMYLELFVANKVLILCVRLFHMLIAIHLIFRHTKQTDRLFFYSSFDSAQELTNP